MMFDAAFEVIVGHEGGYVNHPKDPGKATRYGVTQAVARENGYTGDMRHLPLDVAKTIYRKKYWDAVHADALPGALALQVFDAAVNHGVGAAITLLQRALGVKADGVLGPVTLNAAAASNGRDMAVALLAHRLEFYTDLRTWGVFGRGWARRVAKNLHLVLKG